MADESKKPAPGFLEQLKAMLEYATNVTVIKEELTDHPMTLLKAIPEEAKMVDGWINDALKEVFESGKTNDIKGGSDVKEVSTPSTPVHLTRGHVNVKQ